MGYRTDDYRTFWLYSRFKRDFNADILNQSHVGEGASWQRPVLSQCFFLILDIMVAKIGFI